MENKKNTAGKTATVKTTAAPKSVATAPLPLPPLFRRIDWVTGLFAFAVVWTIYYLTLAPEVTLEDSGELCTGSFYAGIPHPPGYPFWAIYSWIWTKILPFGNVAWRVEVGESMASAFACGLLAMMVSRGSSMLIEGIEELRGIMGKWENAICMVTGVVAGLLMGLDFYMWSESVAINRISLFGVPWVMLVVICLFRWIYAPHQLGYLYTAMFFFGICATIHQTLIVMAMGVEVCILVARPRLGRDLLLANSLAYCAGLLFISKLPIINASSMMLTVFHLVGLSSIVGCGWIAMNTQELGKHWKAVILMAVLWALGTSFYFYEPIAGMTNPPMQWGYPRTVEGFFHAVSRGQYEKMLPTNVFSNPSYLTNDIINLASSLADSFGWAYLFISLLPYLFFLKMQKRERAWITALTAVYFCIGFLLMIIMSPGKERASWDLSRVFFTSSHTIVAIMIGYGLALTAAYMATHYARFRRWGFLGGAIAFVLGLYSLIDNTGKHYFGLDGHVSLSELPHWIAQSFAKDQYGLPIIGSLLLVILPVLFIIALLIYKNRAPLFITLALFALMPLYSGLCHWGGIGGIAGSEQRNHWFGYWFGHDMFTPPFNDKDGKPLYPEMTKDTILYGGTDPGRFCPTYMIFCESFIPHDCQPKLDQKFDRRDVYLITQNALADGTYLCYLRAQYNRSKQIDPPFFSELARYLLKDKEYQTNLLAKIVSPLDTFFTWRGARIEKRWRVSTSWFTAEDFANLPAFAAKLRPGDKQDPLSKWLYQNFSPKTQELLSGQGNDNALRKALIKDLNQLLERELEAKKQTSDIKIDPLYDASRFAKIKLSEYLQDFISQNPQSDTRIRLNRLLLEEAYPNEIVKSHGGVYPDREIYMASPEDSQQCFNDYMQDAQRRMQLNQLKPGEAVSVQDGKLQVSGQVAVMAINGLLTKVIFDHNPKNDFYIEESFPLDWMVNGGYLTPYGIIMKINRQPVPEITEDMCRRDHEFWKQFSKRTVGDFIDYDTPVSNIVAFVEKTYLRHNFAGFTGDRKFIRDDQAQKAFSKLRSSIASSVYGWRINDATRKGNAIEQQRMIREADFAYRQAFAYCPYSPEAVFHYVQLLATMQRFDDALLIAQTAAKLDPFNGQIAGLVENLAGVRNSSGNPAAARLQKMEQEFNTNPANFQNAFDLAGNLAQMHQPGRAAEVLRAVLNNPKADAKVVLVVAQAFSQMNDIAGLEITLDKLVQLMPDSPEGWYDLAALKVVTGKQTDAFNALGHALELSGKRLARDPKARDLSADVLKDRRFDPIRSTAEFQKLVTPQ